jgi:hypothetical protein
LLENINPTIGLANGTPISYHLLQLDPRENMKRILESMCNESGNIQLCCPPRYLFVEIKGKLPKNHKDLSMETEDTAEIPMKPVHHPIDYKIFIPGLGEKIVYSRPHDIELGFAVTLHKIQGQTC